MMIKAHGFSLIELSVVLVMISLATAIVMPNLTLPILTGQDAIQYKKRIEKSIPKEDNFLPLVTLYLTENTNK